MSESGLFLIGNDADLLRRALSEVKTKVYEESEASLDDTQALDTLVSYFRTAEMEGQQKKGQRVYLNPLRKHLVLGTIIGRKRRTDRRES
ncbi:MAG: hypothetical protein WCB79_08945 [Halobacteriota archaeon]